MAKVWYVSLQDVKDAYSIKTAKDDIKIQRAINAASDEVESMLHRKFYPEIATHYFSGDDFYVSDSGELVLNYYDILNVTNLIVNGSVVSSEDYFLTDEPMDSNDFPSDFTSLGRFDEVVITGVYGYSNRTVLETTLVSDITEFSISLTITNSSNLSPGNTIKLGNEFLKLGARTQTDTGQTLQTALNSNTNDQMVAVTDSSDFNVGEFILIEAEKMRITDIAGNSLIVTRAVDGSTLAAHTTGKMIYSPRTFKVTRGILGTIAVAHTAGTEVYRFTPPGLIQSLTMAETMNILAQQDAAYGRVIGSGESQREAGGRGLNDIRKQAMTAYRRYRSGSA
jgi:hypothetical protein